MHWFAKHLVLATLDRVRSTANQPIPPPRARGDEAILRIALRSDAQSMHRVYQASLSGPRQEAVFLRLVRCFPQLCVIATHRGSCVGYTVGRIRRGIRTHRLAAYLHSFAIEGEARRKGVGTALFQFFLDNARTLGVAEVDLEVDRENRTAIALYSRSGLEVLPEAKTGNDATLYMGMTFPVIGSSVLRK